MIKNIENALYEKLATTAAVTNLVGSFNMGDSPATTQPAIFFGKTVPSNSPTPFIWCPGSLYGDTDDDISGLRDGVSMHFSVYAVVDSDSSSASVSDICDAIRDTLHGAKLIPAGATKVSVVRCAPPQTADSDDSLEAKMIVVKVMATEG